MLVNKILGWIGVGLLGAATAVFGQFMTNASTKKDVEAYIEEHKDELFDADHEETEQEGE